ncbi:MAG TPA: ATP-binding protein [Longimicrobiaceae bacterium]|nr:ATP-binding protein [Longimicrobiaceae bacterium]
MTTSNAHLFRESATLRVRQVELRADDSVQRHREKLARIVLDEMYQFVALLDVQGTLLEVNRAALEGGGIRLEDIAGKPFWEAHWWTVSRATQEKLMAAVVRAARGEFIRYDVEVYGGAAGSETIVIDFSMIPVRDTEGEVVFLLPEGRNITEKKRAEAEVARKNQELEDLLERIRELDEIKSQFFANVSHELRTPLALIMGPAEKILSEGANLTDLQRRDLGVIRRNASMLLKHVNDLLDLAKLDAGKMTLECAELDLATLVRMVAGHFDALAPQRQISFVVDTPEHLPAQVDPEKLERVLLNLLSNAFKFTPDGGRVRCALRPTDRGQALISVQDSGPGIRPELRQGIFERFRQGDGGANRQFGGTGLGLAIARDFVELHGGTIGVTDAPGGGALFLVEVPLRAPEGTRVRSTGEAAPAPGASASLQGAIEELRPLALRPAALRADLGQPFVLVVEDNPEMNRFLAETLSEDFRVATAFDGREGLEKALALRPDLIVSDLMMPGMSGNEMITRIRAHGGLDGVPILVLSAKADDLLRIQLLREGAQDYVVKPFSAEEVKARATNLVRVKRARDLLQGELESRDGNLEALAAELVQRRREAEAASRAKSEFMAVMSHELRTPLTAVIGYADILESRIAGPLNDGQEQHIGRIRQSAWNLTEIIDQILTYSRAEAGAEEVRAQEADVVEVARDSLAAVCPAAGRKGVECVARLPGGPLHLETDAGKLRRILLNLLGNAVKFTDTGRVELDVSVADAHVLFRVHDTGRGIHAEHLQMIFEPFRQVDQSYTRTSEGTGLGLAIALQLARLLQGELEVESAPGEGSTFTLRLPLRTGRPRAG